MGGPTTGFRQPAPMTMAPQGQWPAGGQPPNPGFQQPAVSNEVCVLNLYSFLLF